MARQEKIEIESCKPYGIKVHFRFEDRVKQNIENMYILSVKDTIDLADRMLKAAYEIVDEVNSVPIVPSALKALIDLGKVSTLHYRKHIDNEDTGLSLYLITAHFVDGAKREYYFECKFFEDEQLRNMQMEYVNNIPIYFNSAEGLYGAENFGGHVGYNITPKEDEKNERCEDSGE